MALEAPSKTDGAAAVAATSEAAKKRDAAPSWGDLAGAFGEQGLDRDASGNPCGYRYPRGKDEAEQASINAKAYELWNPQRRVAVEQGARHNARTPSVRLVHRESGRTSVVPAMMAEKKARKAGLVEAPVYGRRARDFTVGAVLFRNGEFQRYAGGNRWERVEG